MTLTQLRAKRTTIKNEIERKHNDWLTLATNNECEAADVCAKTIVKLQDLLDQTDGEIVELKEQLIREAL